MKIAITILCLIAISTACMAQTSNYKLTVRIEGLRSNKGQVVMALFDSTGQKRFPNKKQAIIWKTLPIGIDSTWTLFDSLSTGKYAIMALHDEDSNGDLTKNRLGLPKEGIGFCQTKKAGFAPPNWKDAHFTLHQADTTIYVTIHYR